jgi:zinc-ribbon domain
MFCPQCGSSNQDTVSYCIRCGANLGEIRRSLSGVVPASPGVKIHLSLQQILRTGWWSSLIGFLLALVGLFLAITVWPYRGLFIGISLGLFVLSFLASNVACLIAKQRLNPLVKDAALTGRENMAPGLSSGLENTSFTPPYTFKTPPASVSESTTRNLSKAALPLVNNQED